MGWGFFKRDPSFPCLKINKVISICYSLSLQRPFLLLFKPPARITFFLNKNPIHSNRYIYFFHYGTQHSERLQGLQVFPLANIAS
jgi:hypothetical protein